MERQDIRITKTQRAVVFALFTLLEKQSFQKITVNDICQEAMVSRSTFYAHFEDKYALLKYCMDDLKCKLFEEHGWKNVRERIHELLCAVQKNARVIRNLFLTDVNEELMFMMRNSLIADFTMLLEKLQEGGVSFGATIPLTATFYAGGISSIIMSWISSGFETPLEEVERSLNALLPHTDPQ